MPEVFKATAPGSCMLMGEYAVLFEQPALVCAIDCYMQVTLRPRQDRKLLIHSALGEYESTLDTLTIDAPFEFVLTAIQQQSALPSGFDLHIDAEFSDQLGFGSSAAVTVATLACLWQWTKQTIDQAALVTHGRQVIQTVQGIGSGADVAASVYGGLIRYQRNKATVETISLASNLQLIYSGNKARTKTVVKQLLDNPDKSAALMKALPECASLVNATQANLEKQDWSAIKKHCQNYHQLYLNLGASTPDLENILKACTATPSLHAAKISGAGFGDCVIALGDLPDGPFAGYQHYPVTLAKHGLRIMT